MQARGLVPLGRAAGADVMPVLCWSHQYARQCMRVARRATRLPRTAAAAGSGSSSSSSSGGGGTTAAPSAGKGFGSATKKQSQPQKRQSGDRAPSAAQVAPPTTQATGSVRDEPLLSPRAEAKLSQAQYEEIYDRLIDVFQSRPRDDWKKLIVLSKQWAEHRAGVLDRVRARADGEADVDAKMRLRRLFRSLQGVDAEVTRYNDVLERFLSAAEEEWEAVVAVYRGDLQRPFFEHMQVRQQGASHPWPPGGSCGGR